MRKFIITTLKCFAFLYVCFVFIFTNINPFEWQQIERTLLIILTIGGSFIIALFNDYW
jgi:hypothetical protein